jgi:hypothetical protein
MAEIHRHTIDRGQGAGSEAKGRTPTQTSASSWSSR